MQTLKVDLFKEHDYTLTLPRLIFLKFQVQFLKVNIYNIPLLIYVSSWFGLIWRALLYIIIASSNFPNLISATPLISLYIMPLLVYASA